MAKSVAKSWNYKATDKKDKSFKQNTIPMPTMQDSVKQLGQIPKNFVQGKTQKKKNVYLITRCS